MGVLERLQASGLPETVKADNGNGFILQALDAWAHRHAVKLELAGQASLQTTLSLKASTADCGKSA